MRLIDVEKLIEEFSGTGNFDAVEVRSRIEYVPTAYDLNKVVEQLEAEKGTYFDGLPCEGTKITVNAAIEIVKSGVKK